MKDEKISTVALQKFRNHLWYLSPEATRLAFFDETIPVNVKPEMVENLKMQDEDYLKEPKKYQLNFEDINTFVEKQIDSFVTPQTKRFFDRFNIDKSFLEVDPAEWSNNINYKYGLKTVTELRVVNDAAEQAVRLFDGYCSIITHNEEQKQFVIQIVSKYRKLFPNAKKTTVINKFQINK